MDCLFAFSEAGVFCCLALADAAAAAAAAADPLPLEGPSRLAADPAAARPPSGSSAGLLIPRDGRTTGRESSPSSSSMPEVSISSSSSEDPTSKAWRRLPPLRRLRGSRDVRSAVVVTRGERSRPRLVVGGRPRPLGPTVRAGR